MPGMDGKGPTGNGPLGRGMGGCRQIGTPSQNTTNPDQTTLTGQGNGAGMCRGNRCQVGGRGGRGGGKGRAGNR